MADYHFPCTPRSVRGMSMGDSGWFVYFLVYVGVSCFVIRRVVRDVGVAGVCEIRGPVCSTE